MTTQRLKNSAKTTRKRWILSAALVAAQVVTACSLPALASAASPRNMTVVPRGHRAAALLPVVDQSDILPAQRILADQVLRALPSSCRDNLRNFYVTYDPNPANRGLGGEDTIIVTGKVPDSEFMALIIHECGHVSDIGGLRGSPDSGTTAFRDGTAPIFTDDQSTNFYKISWTDSKAKKRGIKSTDFVSGYAASDPFEDFAETYAYYALQQKAFKAAAAKNKVLAAKYNFMATVIFTETAPIADGSSPRGKSVPWDVTKLPYVWHAKRLSNLPPYFAAIFSLHFF